MIFTKHIDWLLVAFVKVFECWTQECEITLWTFVGIVTFLATLETGHLIQWPIGHFVSISIQLCEIWIARIVVGWSVFILQETVCEQTDVDHLDQDYLFAELLDYLITILHG